MLYICVTYSSDIRQSIYLPCLPSRYYMILIDPSTSWHINTYYQHKIKVFARLLTQIIHSRVQFPDYTIKKICIDNVDKFIYKKLLYVKWNNN